MQLFCPACQAAFPWGISLPAVRRPLLMPHEVSTRSPAPAGRAPPAASPQPSAGSPIGTVLALGLYSPSADSPPGLC